MYPSCSRCFDESTSPNFTEEVFSESSEDSSIRKSHLGHGEVSINRKHGKPEGSPESKNHSATHLKKLFRTSVPEVIEGDLLNLPRLALSQIVSQLPQENRKKARLACRSLYWADQDSWWKMDSFRVVKEAIFFFSLSQYRTMSLAMLRNSLRKISLFWQPRSFRCVDFYPDGGRSGKGKGKARFMVLSHLDLRLFWMTAIEDSWDFCNVTQLGLRNCIIGLEELYFLAERFRHIERLSLSESLVVNKPRMILGVENGVVDRKCMKGDFHRDFWKEWVETLISDDLKDEVCDYRRVRGELEGHPFRIQLVQWCLRLFPNLEFLKLYT